MAAEKGTGQADQPSGRSVWALAPSPAACVCAFAWSPGSWQGVCMETPVHTPEPAPAQALSPSDTCPQHWPHGWLVPMGENLLPSNGGWGLQQSPNQAGPTIHQALAQRGWQAGATGPCREGADRGSGQRPHRHCVPSWALSVVTRIGDRGVGLTSAAAMASGFPCLQRPDPSSLWPEKPRPPSQPRVLSPGMRGRRQWLHGQRCSGGAWVAWLLGGGARSAGQWDGDATGGLAARVGLLG